MLLENIKSFNLITSGKVVPEIIAKVLVASCLDVTSLALAYTVIRFSTTKDMSLTPEILYATILSLLVSIIVRFYILRSLNDSIHGIRHLLSRGILTKFLDLGPSMLSSGLTSLSSDIFSEVEQVINSYIVPFSNLLQSGIVCLFICCGLLYLYPEVTIVLFIVFSLLYFCIFVVTNKYSKRIAQERLHDNDRRFSLVSNVITTYKTIAVYGAKEATLDRFDNYSRRLAKNIGRNQTIGVFPKYAIESLVYIGVALYLVLAYEEGTGIEMILVLGLSAIKLLPSFQTFYHSFNHLRFGLPAFKNVYSTITKVLNKSEFSNHAEERNCVEIKIKSFDYDGKVILKDINFSIKNVGVTSIIGESGSGKSTLLDLILGFENIKNGLITYSPNYSDHNAFMDCIGYVPQEYDLIEGTLLENILFYRNIEELDVKKLLALADKLGLGGLVKTREDLERNLDLGGQGLSGGQKQRISMCRALLRDPKILILDEPTSALDKNSEKSLLLLIKELSENICVIIISHNPDIVNYSDQVVELKKI
ncbi:Polysaccharide biosynthesis protein [Vibrio crassostreae]|nr:Polysaccharide biosynthesis protein [Vibrio crassostreae]